MLCWAFLLPGICSEARCTPAGDCGGSLILFSVCSCSPCKAGKPTWNSQTGSTTVKGIFAVCLGLVLSNREAAMSGRKLGARMSAFWVSLQGGLELGGVGAGCCSHGDVWVRAGVLLSLERRHCSGFSP